MPNLDDYNKKRDFSKTKEPKGEKKDTNKKLAYVIQKHDASHLHFDFRIEYNGTLMSFAVPKGPSFNPKDKRLAVKVEDHPLDYKDFEGNIPKGQYGGGAVIVFDNGTYEPLGDMDEMIKKGDIKILIHGQRLKGKWVLVRLKNKDEEDKNWLLIKEKDEFIREDAGIKEFNTSVLSNLTLEEIKTLDNEKIIELAKGNNIGSKKENKVKNTEENKNKVEGKVDVNRTKNLDKGYKIKIEDIEVTLPVLKNKAPRGEKWVYELKYDGYRMIAHKNGEEVKLITRNHMDYTDKFPKIRDYLKSIKIDSFILDGEIAIFNGDVTDFSALQDYVKNKKGSPIYIAFDLISINHKDLREDNLIKRKDELNKAFLDKEGKLFTISKTIEGNGEDIFNKICSLENQEGIICKRKDMPYIKGRNESWIKVKCDNRQEFLIIGYTKTSKKNKGISSLLLGVLDKGKLKYLGRVGTGFTEEISLDLEKKLEKEKIEDHKDLNFKDFRANEEVFFTKIKYIAEVKYANITKDGLIRQGSFKGLREDKDISDINLELDEKSNDKINDDLIDLKKSIKFSNENKELFKGITKLDVLEYYFEISKFIEPFILNRLLTLIRCPNSIYENCFYQKHLKEDIVGFSNIEFKNEKNKVEEYFYIDNTLGLYNAIQLGTIEFHGWNVKKDNLYNPDVIVFDLDPDEGMDLEIIREGVRNVKSILDELNLKSFLKTSGGKGYHLVVTILNYTNHQKVADFAKNVALLLESKWKSLFTSNMRKQVRKNKIYIDWVRNTLTQTSVLPFSLRNREGGPISFPISYDDLDNISPNDVNIKNYKEYLNDYIKKAPWEEFFKTRQKIK